MFNMVPLLRGGRISGEGERCFEGQPQWGVRSGGSEIIAN